MVRKEIVKDKWFRSRSVTILTILGILFTAIVAGVAGFVSWGHIVEVGTYVGEKYANLLPVTIDGLMLVGTVMGAVDRIRGYRARGWAIVALWTGSLLTLLFNAAYALLPLLTGQGTVISRLPNVLVAVLFAVALLISVETMFHPSRRPLVIKNLVEKTKGLMQQIDTVDVPQFLEPIVTPEPVTVTRTEPKSTPAPTGKRGRKPGPQVPPEKRRAPRNRYWGGDTRPVRVPKPVVGDLEVSVIETDDPLSKDPVPMAMDETLADLVAESPAAPDHDEVVS